MQTIPQRDWVRVGVIGLAAGSILLAIIAATLLYQHRRTRTLVIAAGSASGESYVISQALKVVVERTHSNLRVSVLETGGTAENLRLLEQKVADLAAAQADVTTGPSARSIATLYQDRFQLMVRRGSAIHAFPDLKGKRIALAQVGGQYRSFLHVAQHFGLKAEDFVFIGQDDQSSDAAFAAGATDAAFRVRALGNPSVARLAVQTHMELIRIDHAAAMQIKLPAYRSSIIPEGAYLGSPPIPALDLPTVAVDRTLLANSQLSHELVGIVLQTLVERRQEVAEAIPETSGDVKPLLAEVKPPSEGLGVSPSGSAGLLRSQQASVFSATF